MLPKFLRKHILFCIFIFQVQNLFSQPTLSSFFPASGPVGSTVTITGTNFSNIPANNIVFFGVVRANVTAATTVSLVVTVPAGASFQPISVTVNNLTAWSGQSFRKTFNGAGSQFTPNSFEYTGHIDSVDENIETTRYTLGDIDGDGKIDIITIDRLNNSMSVYRNISGGGNISFAPKLDFITGQSPRSVNIADIDGDGKLDIMVTNLKDNTVSIFKNTSVGSNISFSSKADFFTANQPAAIAIADLDKDGKPDLVINTVNLQGYVSILRNTSSGGTISFAPKTDLQSSGGSIEDIKTADVDGDGKIDILLPNYNLNQVTIFRNLSSPGNMAFAPLFNSQAFQKPDQIELGDFDGDGKPDMIIGHYVNINSPVYRNASTAGNIVFQYTTSYWQASPPTGLTVNDFDGDGKPDFAITNGLESFSLFKNSSTGSGSVSFSPGLTIPAPYNSDVKSADFDGDGIPDLAFNAGMFRVSFWKNRAAGQQIYSFSPASGQKGDTITIHGAHFTGTSSVSFGGVQASSFVVSDSSTILAVVADGSTGEILVKTATDSAHISGFTFLGPPSLTSFSPVFGGTGDTITISGINFSNFDTVRFGGTPASSFRLSAPGVIKAVVGAGTSGNVSIANFYGSSTLPGFSYYPIPVINSFTPVSGAAGTSVTITGTDFTKVSAVSIGAFPVLSFNIVSSTTITAVVNEGVTGRIRVTTPGGTGISAGIFSFPKPIVTALLPASGAPGTVTTIQGANFISDTAKNIVFFGAVRAQVIAATPTSLQVIVPSGGTYQPVSVTLNGYTVFSKQPFIQTFSDGNSGLSASSFPWKNAFRMDGEIRHDYICDIDGDGKSDIVVFSETIEVLRNLSLQGTPSFATGVDISNGRNDYSAISIGDINSDGKPDIASVNGVGAVTILKNTSTIGNISFERTTFYINSSPGYITLQDFNGDGKVDLAVSSIDNYLGTLGSVSVIPNIGTEGDIAFGTIFTINLTGAPLEIQSDDIDNDGSPDIILKNGNSISILRNLSSSLNFSFDTPINFDAFNSSAYSYYCMGDFDGDGKPDILTSGDSNLYVLHNTSSNNIISFDAKLNVAAMHQVIENVSTGQLDGDGKPDLVVVGEKKIFAFHNESSIGAISFATSAVYTPKLTYNWTDDAAIGDIDGDGKPDIVTANAADQKVSIFKSGIWETVDSVCGNNNTSLASDISGSTYQWQVNTGSGFINLSEDSIHEGVTTASLEIHHIPVQYNGYQFRCVVDGKSRNTTNLVVTPAILPLGSASSAAKICADSIFNIEFTAIKDIPLNSAIELWESINGGSFTKIASQPYNGVPIETPQSVSTASTRSYFFRILPLSTTLCETPNNTDTTSIVITQLSVPVIAAVGDTIKISNSIAGVSYTWQIQDILNKWNDIVPAANGNSYTAIVSGDFRVMAMQNGCKQYSDKQTITIVPVSNNSPGMKVYPNPANNQITVEHSASEAGANIRIFDMTGRIVKLVLVQENSTKTIIHVENLTPGIFKLILTDGKDSFTKTVLISR